MVLVPVNPQSRPAEPAHALRLTGAVRLYRRGGPPLGLDVEVVELDGRPEALLDGGADDVRPPVVDPDAPAQIQFTSGTTGLPDPDGRLRIVGRLKDMIKTGGENVSPEEVE